MLSRNHILSGECFLSKMEHFNDSKLFWKFKDDYIFFHFVQDGGNPHSQLIFHQLRSPGDTL